MALAKKGGAIMVPDRECTGEKLASLIKSLYSNGAKMKDMSDALLAMGAKNAAVEIAGGCIRLLEEK